MIFIKTNRLLLRTFQSEDLNTLFNYRNDLNCSKYQRWENCSLKYLESLIQKNKPLKILDKKTLQLAIAMNSTNKIVGDVYIGFKNKTITLGYTIASKYQRKGYAYEMLRSLIDYVFDTFPQHEIVCMVHPDNEPSLQLLKKLNFKDEGYEKSIESIVYSLS